MRKWILGIAAAIGVVLFAGVMLLAETVSTVTQMVVVVKDLSEQQELQRLAIKRHDAQLKQLGRKNDSRNGVYEITAYTCQKAETGKSPGDPGYCMTANGTILTPAHDKKVVAADPSILPFGTRLWIDGVGEVTVVDTGGEIVGRKIDLFAGEKKVYEARAFGRVVREVTVLP